MRMTNICAALIVVSVAWSAAGGDPSAMTQQQIVEKLVASYGFDQWSQVESIRFTFNVERKGQPGVTRTWQWSPATGEVNAKYADDDGAERTTNYNRNELGDDADAEAVKLDGLFIHDTFWLLFPLHLSRAEDVTITVGPVKLGPLKRHIAREITVVYPGDSDGGTPGDVYKLYVDDAWRIVAWSHRRGGEAEPTLATIWAQDVAVGPLTLCSRFGNPETKFKLYFTDLAVKVAGEGADADQPAEWQAAKRVKHGCRGCP